MATYTKLKSGDWGIKIDGKAEPGQRVTVTKASGETRAEVVDKVIWSNAEISLCTIKPRVASVRPAASAETKTCWECGREFTYAEAKRYDGDWSDSYCGC